MREMKDSCIQWIGKIPKNWDVRPIKNSFSIVSGSTPDSDKAEYWEGGIPWITPADFKTIDKYTSGGSRFITEKGYDSCSTNMIPKGSIIFSKRAPIGSVVINKIDLCTNQGCLSCIKNDKTDSTYFYYLMSIYDDVFNLFGSGTTFKEISATTFGDFILPLPPLVEQQLVSSFLDSKCAEIDALTADIQKEIETLQEYRKSVITEAVTKGLDPNVEMKDSGVEWIGEIPKEWLLNKGKYIFIQRNDRGNTICLQLLSPTQKYGVIPQDKYEELSGMKAVKLNEKVNLAELKTVHVGAYCISLRSFQGGFEYSNYEGVVSPAYQIFYPRGKINDDYYKYLFKTEGFIQEMNSFTMSLRDGKNIAFEDFGNSMLPVPPLSEQNNIADFLNSKCSEIDSIIANKQKQLETLAEYRKSLIYEYVTGKNEVPTA